MKCQIITNSIKNFRTTNIGGLPVHPILRTPKLEEVQDILELNSKLKLGEGTSGTAYEYGENVIKVFDKILKKLAKKYLFSEMDNLASLSHLITKSGNENYLHNTQKGLFAFEKDRMPILVSSKVEGEIPHPVDAPFNDKNLEALVETFHRLDKGFGRTQFLQSDMRPPNMKITENNAGLLDFEYLRKIKLGNEKNLEETEKSLPTITKSNYAFFLNESDTGYGTSNLRAFEYETLAPYLYRSPSIAQAQETFRNYVKLKSEHHFEMAHHYKKLQTELGDEIFKRMEAEEACHYMVLNSGDKDILHTEAAKLQMYSFLRWINLTAQKLNAPALNLAQIESFFDKERANYVQAINRAITNKDATKLYYYKNAKDTADKVENLITYSLETYKIPPEKVMQKQEIGLLTNKLL